MDRNPRGIGGERVRRLSILAVGSCVLVLLGACSNGTATGSARLDRPTTTTSTTTTSTTSSQQTTTPARAVSDTDATTKVTTPRQPSAEPRVTASPAAAAPGTRVSITGDGFTADHWKTPGVPLWLAGGPSDCDFFVEADHDVRVSVDGHLVGSFVVPSRGACRQSSVDDVPVQPGRYRIVYQCTACTIGELNVTQSRPPTPAQCPDVGFAPNSDDLADDILAYGVRCPEAEAVVRKVGGSLGPVQGASRAEADGFTCVRTGQREGPGLPSADYECTRGAQSITFTRT
jgi:hypothetical protein